MKQRVCEHSGCWTWLEYSGKGRPPKWCKRHNPRQSTPTCCLEARAVDPDVLKCNQHKEQSDELRYIRNRRKYQPSTATPMIDSPDGLDIDISTREPWYAGNGAGTLDGQSDSVTTDDLYGNGTLTEHDIRIHGGYRITSGDRLDSYFIPDPPLTWLDSGTKNGYDTAIENLSR